jgi:hypothetical protein
LYSVRLHSITKQKNYVSDKDSHFLKCKLFTEVIHWQGLQYKVTTGDGGEGTKGDEALNEA